MTAKVHWLKLWQRWYSSTSHADLAWQTLHLGPGLLMLCRTSPEPGWLIRPDGKPMTTLDVARRTRAPAKTISRALTELVGCGTFAQRDDGAWGAPNMERWQESASAARMRRHRDKRSDVTVRHSDGHVTVQAEAEAEAEADNHPPSPPAKRDTSPVVLEFPVRSGGAWALREKLRDDLAAAFPGVDLATELRKALLWVETEPTRRKTSRGMPAFLRRWMGNAKPASSGYAKITPERTYGGGRVDL